MMRTLRLLFLLSIAVSSAAPAADAQELTRIGNFYFERKADLIDDEDESFAGVASEDGAFSVMWRCFGADVAIGFGIDEYSGGPELPVVWRFDRDRPDTTLVSRLAPGSELLMLPPDYHYAFSTRARTAQQLVVRTMERGRYQDYVLNLDGSERALGSLACVRNLRPPALGEARDDGMPPRTTLPTRADTLALIAANYPPLLARAGVRGEVAVRVRVDAQGVAAWQTLEVIRTANPQLSDPARVIVAQIIFPPADRPRWLMVYVYFGPDGGHIQHEEIR